MKITCILGSPRTNGNSAAIAEKFCETAEKKGAEVTKFRLNKMDYSGCQGCMACKLKYDKCILKDDLADALDSVRDSDITVLSTPVYFGDVTSQAKGFIDRTYSYLKPNFYTEPTNASRLRKGKKLVFIMSQGAPKEHFSDIFPRYEVFFKWMFDEVHFIRGCELVSKDSAVKSKKIMQSAEEMAYNI